MRVSSFEVRDFRSWEHAQVRLGEGSTLFLGRNGYGKTNLVEALGVLSSLSSHRGAQIAAMVRRGAPEAAISADVLNEGRKLTVGLRLTPGKATKAQLNGVNRPTREVAGVLRTVFFSPEDLALVRGEPGDCVAASERRQSIGVERRASRSPAPDHADGARARDLCLARKPRPASR